VLQHEKAFESKVNGLGAQLARLVMYKNVRASRNKAMNKVQGWTARRRGMMLSFAAHAYELEKGKRAASAADLVPVYLKKIPQDPLTGTNLFYNP
jgi:hypothetical protein